ncbi:nitroreductase [Nocardia puris]|uniref:Nitroreductase n=1 Tax=Nocardia puris TaxID=208602 RepID=A0A366DMA8_9NOCA|nr:nitroreductase [Nocardia puris]MBF6213112.1 nitroreductase [Nocardia puris]MBF6368102.1 nitroreductase [Nocardia puris]MBF6462736.1 nitroreductase [Nocardia puris]RBO90358.1 nitroreductase [Nocardia puris]
MSPTEVRTDAFATLAQTLDERWTCRQFRPEPVPRQTIEDLLRVAQRTPSWCNTQPWQLAVTEGAATERFRAALLEHVRTAAPATDFAFPARYDGIYRDRRRECGFQLYDSVGVVKGDHEGTTRQALRNFELFDAPHVAIVTTEADLGVYGAVDCGLYIGTFLLAAQTLGLGAAPQAALASYAPFLREHFAFPDNRRVVAAISFGYPDTDHPVNGFRTRRADLTEAVTWFGE